MKESLFSKIYSYRERENKHSKENFLIEIFSHCLDSDKKLLKDFFELINLTLDSEVNVKTQSVYDLGRPDIEINIEDTSTCILIECKIEHFERENQLEDYKRILETKSIKNKHLVYLTKYYDFRENTNKKIHLHQLRWQDVFKLIDEENTQFAQELKQYIKDENMSNSKNFNYTDLSVLKSITNTILKMDEVLDGVKEYYEQKIGKLSKDSSRSSRMKDEWYGTYQYFTIENKYAFEISFGFYWWDEDVYIGARVYISQKEKHKNAEEVLKLFKKTLKNWDLEDEYDDCIYLGFYEPVAQFVIDTNEQIPPMTAFLKNCVNQLEKMKQLNPRLFK